MANSSRTDRQLMRQRGAGLRNVDTIDFGLNFGSQGSREDRQLMRQRGAGRKVDNIDFGFSFPTPSQSRRSSRTPQSTNRGLRRSSKTPASNARRRASTPPTTQTDAVESQIALESQQRLSRTPQRNFSAEQPNSGKRRRLNKNVEGVDPKEILVNMPKLAQPLSEVSNIAGNREHERAMYAEEAEATTDKDSRKLRPGATPKNAPLFVDQGEDKENAMSINDEPTLSEDQRKARPLHNQSGTDGIYSSVPLSRRSFLQSIEDPDTISLPTGSDDAGATEPASRSQISEQPTQLHETPSVNLTDAADRVAGSDTASRKKKKRKSVVLGPRKKRRSSEVARQSPSVAEVESSATDTQAVGSLSREQDEEQQDVIGDESETIATNEKPPPLWKRLAARRMQGRRNRLSVSASPASHEREDEEADETYVEVDDSPEPITPAAKKKRSKEPHKRGAEGHTNVRQGVKSSRTSFPIVTYRTTNTEALPTILEEDERSANSEAGEERLPDAFANRPQPNAVDVLAQICRETIQTALGKLEAVPTVSTSRADIKHKRTALEAFGERVDQRLFDMSQAVEQRMTSEARLRKSRREKAELQARWVEIRRQRDELALKSDTIRRQNWENEEEGKRQFEISELAHQTELELERGEASDVDDLEFMLRHVAGNVSTTTGRGGILSRLKSFNGLLERIAVALDG